MSLEKISHFPVGVQSFGLDKPTPLILKGTFLSYKTGTHLYQEYDTYIQDQGLKPGIPFEEISPMNGIRDRYVMPFLITDTPFSGSIICREDPPALAEIASNEKSQATPLGKIDILSSIQDTHIQYEPNGIPLRFIIKLEIPISILELGHQIAITLSVGDEIYYAYTHYDQEQDYEIYEDFETDEEIVIITVDSWNETPYASQDNVIILLPPDPEKLRRIAVQFS